MKTSEATTVITEFRKLLPNVKMPKMPNLLRLGAEVEGAAFVVELHLPGGLDDGAAHARQPCGVAVHAHGRHPSVESAARGC